MASLLTTMRQAVKHGGMADLPPSATRPAALPGPEAMKGHAAMLAFSALVAGSFSLGSMAAPYMNPVALNALRFGMAVLVIGSIVLARGLVRRRHFDAPWRYLVLGGLFAIYFALMFEGLKTASPVSMAAVFTLTPLMSACFGWVLMRQVSTPRMALALALATCGAIWVIFEADWQAIRSFRVGRGEAVFFVGCIAHALYTPMVPRLRRSEPVMVLTLGTLCAGFIFLTAVGAPALAAIDWSGVPMIVWGTIVYLAVFASSVTFYLVQYAALRLPSAKVMAYTYLTPAWVILWEGFLGSSWPSAAILAGVAMVVAALLLLLKE